MPVFATKGSPLFFRFLPSFASRIPVVVRDALIKSRYKLTIGQCDRKYLLPHLYTQTCVTTPILLGLPVHDRSPAAFGLVSYMGFDEMIPADAPLPYCKKSTLRTVFDYVESDNFAVAYRYCPRDAFQEIGRITLTNIHRGEAKDVKLYARMTIDRTLTGLLHIRDPYTRSEVSLTFDARVPPPKDLLLSDCKIDGPISN